MGSDSQKSASGDPRRLRVGVNDLASAHPEIAKLWSERNRQAPAEFHKGSNSKAWFLCEENSHEIFRSIQSFVRSSGACAICAGQETLSGFNDLATRFPELATQWDEEANGYPASQASAGSRKILAHWRCERGHSYRASAHNRRNGRGCPYCAGRRVLAGFNDLRSRNRELAAQWDESNLLPSDGVTESSGKIVVWRCDLCDHRWEASPARRKAGHGCPSCASHSRLESLVEKHLRLRKIPYVRSFRELRSLDENRVLELDFYLPTHGLGFEVQDLTTHSRESDVEPIGHPLYAERHKKGPAYHQRKRDAAEASGIRLVELWQEAIEDRSFEDIIDEEIRCH